MDILYWTKKSKKKENHFDTSKSGGGERETGTCFPLILIDQSQEVTPESNSNAIYFFLWQSWGEINSAAWSDHSPSWDPLAAHSCKGFV